MTDQNKNIEILQTDVTQITTDLEDAKKLTDETLQKSKAEEAFLEAEVLSTQVTTAKDEANKKLEALKGKTDATSKAEIVKLEAEIKKYETMLETLTSSKRELTKLKSDVQTMAQEDLDKTAPADNTKVAGTEKKNRFKRQIDGFSDKAEENHGLKNAGRIALGIGAGILVWKWIKALFGGNKEKKAKTAWSEKTFLEKARAVTKVVAVGWWIYYVIHGLATGKWSLNDFFDRKQKPGYESNDPEAFDDLYEKKSKEEKEQYDTLWTAVNEFFGAVYWTTTGESGSDMLGEQTGDDKFEKHVWIMPCALDDVSSDVGDILDGTSDFGKKLDDFWSKVSKDIGKQINPLEWFSGGWASQEDLAKLDKETVWKYQAYRKTLKVQVFLHQKEKVLVRRLIAERLGITNYTTASEDMKKTYDEKIDTAMDDDDVMDAVETKMKTVYYNQKLTGVMAVFKKYDITNTEMVEDTTVAIQEVDQDKNDLIGSTLDEATASPDINSDTTLKDDVSTLCTDFDTKINDEDNQLADFDNFFIGLWDAWINSEAGDKQEILKSIGYTEKIGVYSSKVLAIKEKIANGTATKTDMAELKKTIEDYYIFKKDIVLWISFVHEADDKSSGLERTLMYIWGKLIAVLERAWDKWGIVWVTIAAFVMRQSGKAIVKWWKKLVLTSGKNRIRWLGKDPGRLLPGRRLYRFIKGENFVAKTLRMQAYNGKRWYEIFQKRFKNGRMTLSETQQILDYHWPKWETEVWIKNITVDDMLESWGYIRKNVDNLATRTLIWKYFDTSKNVRLALKWSNRAKFLSSLTKYDDKLKLLETAGETKKIKFMEDVLTYARLKNWDELLGVIKNIDAIDVSTLEDVQITDLAKKLGRKITAASTTADITKHIDEIKKTVTTTVTATADVIDNVKVNAITKMIDEEIVIMKWSIGVEGSPNRSKARVSYYNKSVEWLEQFKKQANLMTEVDFNTIKKMTAYGFKLDSVAKLHRMAKLDATWIIDETIKKGDPKLLRDMLVDIAAKDTEFAKYVVKSDIDDVVSNIDVLIKKAATANDAVEPLLKNMDNIFKLFTKLT